MKSTWILTVLVLLVVSSAAARTCQAFEGTLLGRTAAQRGSSPVWSQPYYDPAWGMPLAVLVPPTANRQVHYSWGVGGTRLSPIYPQFSSTPMYPTPYYGQYYSPMPGWPSSTDQFGDYYVRGPW